LLRMAMRALARRDDPISAETLFEELIVNFIMEGGDADTNAAVAGAVLGAYLG
jgi:ADP-ribosylglycohydrolase